MNWTKREGVGVVGSRTSVIATMSREGGKDVWQWLPRYDNDREEELCESNQ